MAATKTLKMTIVFEQGEDGWVIASIPEVPGAHSQGKTREEARENVLDALQVRLTPDDALAARDSEPLLLTVQ